MIIYLVLLDDERCLFCSDDATFQMAAPEDPSAPRAGGLKGYVLGKLEHWKTSWREDQSGIVAWMRRAWDWLHTWTRPDEPMLARLWSSHELLIRHPSTLSYDESRAIWNRYLRAQFHRHLLWMSVNGAIAVPTAFLFILPGPNLIGYWFAYRSVHHALASWGIGKTRRGVIPVRLEPMPELDVAIEHDADGKPRHQVLDAVVSRLEEHLRRSRWLRWSKRVGDVPTCVVDHPPTPGQETTDDAASQL